MTDEALEVMMWEASRPWEERWETLKVNESRVEEKEVDDEDKQARFWSTDRTDLQSMKESM